jgi:aminoglycoside phosphotransferase
MGEIGSIVDLRKRSSLIELLSQLHQSQFVHGDPRVPNILTVDNKLKFIDFRKLGHGVRFTPIAKEYDLKILVASAYLNANVNQYQKFFSIPSVAARIPTLKIVRPEFHSRECSSLCKRMRRLC